MEHGGLSGVASRKDIYYLVIDDLTQSKFFSRFLANKFLTLEKA